MTKLTQALAVLALASTSFLAAGQAFATVSCPADLDTLTKKIEATSDPTKRANAQKLHDKAATEMKAGKTKACAKTVTQGLTALK